MDLSKPQLLKSQVMHKRFSPKVNIFRYQLNYLLLPLTSIEDKSIANKIALNKFGLHSFYEIDHGFRDHRSLRSWVSHIHKMNNIAIPKNITLICLPRILGYVFNPVSFWLGTDDKQNITSIIYEVNNTWGETHSYIYEANDINTGIWLQLGKQLHVSPFFPVKGHYKFSVKFTHSRSRILINYYQGSDKKLATSLHSIHMTLNPKVLTWSIIKNPLLAVKVIGLIHFQAIKLLFKNAKFHRQPPPPKTSSSSN